MSRAPRRASVSPAIEDVLADLRSALDDVEDAASRARGIAEDLDGPDNSTLEALRDDLRAILVVENDVRTLWMTPIEVAKLLVEDAIAKIEDAL